MTQIIEEPVRISYPVIRISFGGGVLHSRSELHDNHLIGIEFSREQRSVRGFEVETL